MFNLQTSRDLQGIVKGARWRVSPGIQEMNRRANDCNHAAPWYGNRPGAVRSNAYLSHMIDAIGYEDWDGDEEYDYS